MPVKPFSNAKSRLAGVLSEAERAALSREFLEHALAVLAHVPSITQTLVVSRDPAALTLAQDSGARPLLEEGALGLNGALTQAARVAREGQAGAVLILPTDLPLLTAAEVAQIMAADDGQPRVIIAPDRHEQGTNAMFVRPPERLPFAFGAGSFKRHAVLAQKAGLALRVVRLAGAALDVDVPDDLLLLRAGRGEQRLAR